MLDPYAAAIGSIESGGQADPYTSMGPPTKGGDRAHGKYQIMGANIGPWSKEVLGQEITPEQFLANPQIQDAIFQGKFGQYVDKYGPEGAAKAWFAGERGMNNPDAKDVLGTSVSGYAGKFMKALGAPNPPNAPQMPAGEISPQTMSGYGQAPNNAPAATAASPPSQFDQGMEPLGAPTLRPPDPFKFRHRPGPSRGFSFLRT